MSGRHRAPVDHHFAKAMVGSSLAVAATTGPMLAVTPTPAAQVVPAVGFTSAPASIVTPVIPAAVNAPAGHYTVQSGDTLSGIAPHYGESWQTLYADNTSVVGSDPNLIFPNQVLTVSGVATAAQAPIPTQAAAPPGAHAVTGQHAVDIAMQYRGVPYVWGGASPAGFDCSGLVLYVYRQLGVTLPHNALAQSGIGARVPSLAQAQPGDLLFFYSPVSHVAIYIGNGQMIAAPTFGERVQVQSVWATPTVIRRLV